MKSLPCELCFRIPLDPNTYRREIKYMNEASGVSDDEYNQILPFWQGLAQLFPDTPLLREIAPDYRRPDGPAKPRLGLNPGRSFSRLK